MHHTKSQSRTAGLMRMSFDQVHRAVLRGLESRNKGEQYHFLSIDEKSVKKGHEYISILSDEQSGIVIEVVEGRTKSSVDELCKSLTSEQRADVKTICTDMWDAFIYGANRYFDKALHCHDNFHLVGYLNKAVDKVRRREVKQNEDLKRSKYLFLKDKMKFTDEQQIKFDAITAANHEVSRAWRIKENFRDIQFKQNRTEAISMYAFWRMDAMRTKISEIKKVVEMFDRHQFGIINAIQTGATNARAKRINGSIQELKTIGRGYRNTKNFRTAIHFFHGNLTLFPH